MFAKKIFVSLTIVAALPDAFSRHVSWLDDRVFPHDSGDSRFPSTNIEDLEVPGIVLDVNSNINEQQDSGNEANARNEHSGLKDLISLDDEVNKLDDSSEVQDLTNSVRVNTPNRDFEVEYVDHFGNPLNTQKKTRKLKVLAGSKKHYPDILIDPVNAMKKKPEGTVVDGSEDMDIPVNMVDTRRENREVPDWEFSGNDVDTPYDNLEMQDEEYSGNNDMYDVEILSSLNTHADP